MLCDERIRQRRPHVVRLAEAVQQYDNWSLIGHSRVDGCAIGLNLSGFEGCGKECRLAEIVTARFRTVAADIEIASEALPLVLFY
jgi:hypothetical protein